MKRTISAVLLVLLIVPSMAAFADSSNAARRFDSLISTAQAAATANEPVQALGAYRSALGFASEDPAAQRVVHFGIARMLMWLGRYDEALKEYSGLLQSPLSQEDRELALAGAVNCLSYLNRPRTAYALAKRYGELSSGAFVLAEARAADWSDRPDKARSILAGSAEALSRIQPGTALANQAQDLTDQVRRETATTLTVAPGYARDSDGLAVTDSTLTIRKPSAASAVSFLARKAELTEGSWAANTTSVQARYDTRIGDALSIGAQAGAATYGGWQPMLWSGEIASQPVDAYRISAHSDADTIETPAAIDERITSHVSGLAATFNPASDLTVSGLWYARSFSDGNARSGLTGDIAFAAFPQIGLGLGVRAQAFQDRRSAATGYFDPQRYEEQQLLLTLRRRLGRWSFYASAGIGRQGISPGTASTTTSFQLSASGRRKGCLTLEASLVDSNSALSSPSGYRRSIERLSLSCVL